MAREKLIQIRLHASEKRILERAAEILDEDFDSVTEYIRQTMLADAVEVLKGQDEPTTADEALADEIEEEL